MPDESYQLAVYLSLARASERRRRLLVRDRLLTLAGIQASQMQLFRLSQYCRDTILAHNPKHFVRRWDSISQGLLDEDFGTLTRSIKKRYPLERAEQMLQTLGIDITNERATYYDDVEYAAALLNVDVSLLSDTAGNDPSED